MSVYDMNTALKTTLIQSITVLSVMLMLSGCLLPPCQQLPEEPFQSVTDTEWRLVSTTDANAAANLNNFNFIIFTFTQDFGIQFTTVDLNTQSGNPITEGRYDVIPEQKLIVAELTRVGDGSQSNVVWRYRLGSKLELTDTASGQHYEFYPFEGIVKPDFQCKF